MFDIEKHIEDGDSSSSISTIQLEIEDIESDIHEEIDDLINYRFHGLYLTDKFKYNNHGIDIIYPGITYPGNKSIIKNPDYIRFLLSQYPQKEKLKEIDKIILRPRHVEINDITLVSMYIRNRKILVYNLHDPHFYPIDNSELSAYSLIPFFNSPIINSESYWSKCIDTNKNILKIPPLWYFLSIISFSPDNKIDKFFVINREKKGNTIPERLRNISLFYSRLGY